MKTYPIPMVPGPVSVPKSVLEAYLIDYGSSDLEQEFLELYLDTTNKLKKIYATENDMVIMSGEGMITLWGALKSCLLPGDKVLCVGTGLFGNGIADMARNVGAEVTLISYPDDETLSDLTSIETAIKNIRPKMITAVHCETPSGTLNPLAELGELKKKYDVPLFYVDAVASAGGAPVLTDEWHIDLALGGAQKCLSAPSGLSFMTVSLKAWQIIEKVNYQGYDALKPFQYAVEQFYFPYTMYWHGIAALNQAASLLLEEGLEQSFQRHQEAANLCRNRLLGAGLHAFPKPFAEQSPTVTAVKVPDHTDWPALDRAFRDRGLVVGGNYGPLAGKVFRIGHMGSQAQTDLVTQAMDVIDDVMNSLS